MNNRGFLVTLAFGLAIGIPLGLSTVNASAKTIYNYGIFFQMLGIGIIVIGVGKALFTFTSKSFWEWILSAFRSSRPEYSKPEPDEFLNRIHWEDYKPNFSDKNKDIDSKFEALEKYIKYENLQILAHIREEFRKLRTAYSEEEKARRSSDLEIYELFKNNAIGDLHIILFGVIFSVVGLFLSSFL